MNILTADLADKIIDNSSIDSLTGNEISVLLLLLKRQSIDGYCEGIYWKEISEFLEISKSGFYHVINELQRKGFLEKNKNDRSDTDIILKHDLTALKEDLRNKNNHVKYIKLNINMLEDKEFYRLKANEKRLALILLKRYTNSNDGKLFYIPGEEVNSYIDILNVEARSIKSYYGSLKKWIAVSNERVVNNKLKRIVTILKTTMQQPKKFFTEKGRLKETSEYSEYKAHEQIIKTFCRRNKIYYTKQNLADTASLIKQYRNRAGSEETVLTYLKRAIINSINETLELSSKVVNSILGNIIKLDKKDSVISENTSLQTYNNSNRYSNLEQRQYDYDKLEKEFLNAIQYE